MKKLLSLIFLVSGLVAFAGEPNVPEISPPDFSYDVVDIGDTTILKNLTTEEFAFKVSSEGLTYVYCAIKSHRNKAQLNQVNCVVGNAERNPKGNSTIINRLKRTDLVRLNNGYSNYVSTNCSANPHTTILNPIFFDWLYCSSSNYVSCGNTYNLNV